LGGMFGRFGWVDLICVHMHLSISFLDIFFAISFCAPHISCFGPSLVDFFAQSTVVLFAYVHSRADVSICISALCDFDLAAVTSPQH